MRIAVIDSVPLDLSLMRGSGVVLHNILEALKERGHSTTLFTSLTSNEAISKVKPYVKDVKSIIISKEKILKVSSSYKELYSIIRLHNIISALMRFSSFDYILASQYDSLIGKFDFEYVQNPSRKFFSIKDITKIKSPISLIDFLTTIPFKNYSDIIAANSGWMARRIEKLVKKKVEVLYPPVNLIECYNDGKKENIIANIGAIVEDKRQDHVIYVAKYLRNVKFVIIGRIQQYSYYERLVKEAPDNVIFLTNASEYEKREVLCKAKVILHTKEDEPFGIAIVEGMSAGAIPVVHKSGGAWEDIIDKGKYGFGYEKIEELPEVLKQALDTRIETRDRAKLYSNENFKLNIIKIANL